jgi:hypothetical protein
MTDYGAPEPGMEEIRRAIDNALANPAFEWLERYEVCTHVGPHPSYGCDPSQKTEVGLKRLPGLSRAIFLGEDGALYRGAWPVEPFRAEVWMRGVYGRDKIVRSLRRITKH